MEKQMKTAAFAVTLILMLANSVLAADLCPNVKVDAPDDFIMHEREFTDDAAINSVSIVPSRIYELLKKEENTKNILDSPEFYITFPNSLRKIEGTLLKQKAVIAQKEYKLLKATKSDDAKLREAKSNFEKAKKEFCTFLKSAIYVD
jgi:hypothetical protein